MELPQYLDIYKNTRKEKPNHPDYNMKARIGDVYTDIGACWIKTSKGGTKYMSCSPSKPRPKTEEGEADPKDIPDPDEVIAF